jgi:hypothetical protein
MFVSSISTSKVGASVGLSVFVRYVGDCVGIVVAISVTIGVGKDVGMSVTNVGYGVSTGSIPVVGVAVGIFVTLVGS